MHGAFSDLELYHPSAAGEILMSVGSCKMELSIDRSASSFIIHFDEAKFSVYTVASDEPDSSGFDLVVGLDHLKLAYTSANSNFELSGEAYLSAEKGNPNEATKYDALVSFFEPETNLYGGKVYPFSGKLGYGSGDGFIFRLINNSLAFTPNFSSIISKGLLGKLPEGTLYGLLKSLPSGFVNMLFDDSLRSDDFINFSEFALRLKAAPDPVSQHLKGQFGATTKKRLAAYDPSNKPESEQLLKNALVADLNKILESDSIYDAKRFTGITLREETKEIKSSDPEGHIVRPNRFLLEDAYPECISRDSLKLEDSGELYFSVREIDVRLSTSTRVSGRVALGLPSKLNKLLASPLPTDELKSLVVDPNDDARGLILTYNPAGLGNDETADGLMMASFTLSDSGISGTVDSLPINFGFLAEQVSRVSKALGTILDNGIKLLAEGPLAKKAKPMSLSEYQATEGAILEGFVIDFDAWGALFEGTIDEYKARSQDSESKYGQVVFDFPEFSLSFSSLSPRFKIGAKILGERLNIPLPFSMICKLFGLETASKYVPNKVPVRSIKFFDESGKFNIKDLREYLLDFMEEETKEAVGDFLKPISDAEDKVAEYSGNVLDLMPKRLKEYMTIALPEGFSLYFEATIPDLSVNFSLDVDGPDYPIEAENIDRLKIALPNVTERFWDKLDDVKALAPFQDKHTLRKTLKSYLGAEWDNAEVELMKELGSKDYSDSLMVLFPAVGASQLVERLYGIQIRRIAFGTIFANNLARLTLSGKIEWFEFLEVGAAMALSAIPADKLIPKEIVPKYNELETSLYLDNLLILIVYQTVVPIPIPIYARGLDFTRVDLAGSETHLSKGLKFNLGLFSILKRIMSAVSFFTGSGDSGNEWLLVEDYPRGSKPNSKDIILSTGPQCLKLPSIFGYEHDGKGDNRQKITIGSSKKVELKFFDMLSLYANTIKGWVTKKHIPVADKDDPTLKKLLPPFNYLLKYYPIEERCNARYIKLFYLFDFYAKQVSTTPDEFNELVAGRSQIKTPELDAPIEFNRIENFNELMQPLASRRHENDVVEGGLFIFQGGARIPGVAHFETTIAYGLTTKGGMTGFRMEGDIGGIFAASFGGSIVVAAEETLKPLEKTPSEESSGGGALSAALRAEGSLSFLGQKVLTSKLSLDNDGLHINGKLDLFPDHSLLDIEGMVEGILRKDRFSFEGALSTCRLGFTQIAEASLQIDTEGFFIRGNFMDQGVSLLLQQLGKKLRLSALMDPVNFLGAITIRDADDETEGPKLLIQLGNFDSEPSLSSAGSDITSVLESTAADEWEAIEDSLFGVHLSGYISFLGMERSAHMTLTASGFSLRLKGRDSFLGLFESTADFFIEAKKTTNPTIWEGDNDWVGDKQWIFDLDYSEGGYVGLKGSASVFGANIQLSGSAFCSRDGVDGRLEASSGADIPALTIAGCTVKLPSSSSRLLLVIKKSRFESLELEGHMSLGNLLKGLSIRGKLDKDLYGELEVNAGQPMPFGPQNLLDISGMGLLWRNADGAGISVSNASARLLGLETIEIEEFTIDSKGNFTLRMPYKEWHISSLVNWSMPETEFIYGQGQWSAKIVNSSLKFPWLGQSIQIDEVGFNNEEFYGSMQAQLPVGGLMNLNGELDFRAGRSGFFFALNNANADFFGLPVFDVEECVIDSSGFCKVVVPKREWAISSLVKWQTPSFEFTYDSQDDWSGTIGASTLKLNFPWLEQEIEIPQCTLDRNGFSGSLTVSFTLSDLITISGTLYLSFKNNRFSLGIRSGQLKFCSTPLSLHSFVIDTQKGEFGVRVSDSLVRSGIVTVKTFGQIVMGYAKGEFFLHIPKPVVCVDKIGNLNIDDIPDIIIGLEDRYRYTFYVPEVNVAGFKMNYGSDVRLDAEFSSQGASVTFKSSLNNNWAFDCRGFSRFIVLAFRYVRVIEFSLKAKGYNSVEINFEVEFDTHNLIGGRGFYYNGSTYVSFQSLNFSIPIDSDFLINFISEITSTVPDHIVGHNIHNTMVNIARRLELRDSIGQETISLGEKIASDAIGKSNRLISQITSGAISSASSVFNSANSNLGNSIKSSAEAAARASASAVKNAASSVHNAVKSAASYISSDINLKKDIIPLKDPLNKIIRLNGNTYNWKRDSEAHESRIGLIAQEVEEVFPEVVSTNEEGYKCISYGHLVAPLVEAIKEQQAQIQTLEEAIRELKDSNGSISSKE